MRVGGHYQYNITSQPYKNLASGLNTPPVKDAQNVVSVGWALWCFWERDFFQLVCSMLSSSKSMCNSAILTRKEHIIKKYKIMLRASYLTLEIKILWDENRGKWKGWQPPGIEPKTPLAWAVSALSLSHDSWMTTNLHNPLYLLHRWYWMPQSHTWQPLSMCRQNSVWGWPENSLHQNRIHAEWFSHSKCSEDLASRRK